MLLKTARVEPACTSKTGFMVSEHCLGVLMRVRVSFQSGWPQDTGPAPN